MVAANRPGFDFFTVVALLAKLPIFFKLGLYNRYWRYASVNDLTRVLIAVGLSTTILAVLFVGAHATLLQYNLVIVSHRSPD